MNIKVASSIASAISLLLLPSCVSFNRNAPDLAYAPVKQNVQRNEICDKQTTIGGVPRPTRGVIEGNGSFLLPSWQQYVFNLDTRKLHKIQSAWDLEKGKINIKPSKIDSVDLNAIEIQTIVASANRIWASETKTPNTSETDVAWNINLTDGLEEKCERGLGNPTGNGKILTDNIRAIWESHKPYIR